MNDAKKEQLHLYFIFENFVAFVKNNKKQIYCKSQGLDNHNNWLT